MKTKHFILGAIFLISGLATRAQVYDMYHQNFESGEQSNYTFTPTAGAEVTTLYQSQGLQSLKLKQQTEDEVELVLDTIDVSQDMSLRYIALTFDHICRVQVNGMSGGAPDITMGAIYYKRVNDVDWTKMMIQEYDNSRPTACINYEAFNSFNENSYSEWTNGDLVWKSERFNLNSVMTSALQQQDRKLLIKFVLRRRTVNVSASQLAAYNESHGWWIDSIKVVASSAPMVTPSMNMVLMPSEDGYPNSRGARIMIDTRSDLGINPDSVYMLYTVGEHPSVVHRTALTFVDTVVWKRDDKKYVRYAGRIPFEGFDTLMSFRCVARDITGNATMVTYPDDGVSWATFKFVRGTSQPGIRAANLAGNSTENNYPFSNNVADGKSEFIYDSALMSQAGYVGPGAITSMKFLLGAAVSAEQVRNRFQVRLKNVPANYSVDNSVLQRWFTPYTDYMQVVYDDTHVMPVAASGTELTIDFIDTFYYAGKSMVMQIMYDNDVNVPGTSIKMIDAPSNRLSMWYYNAQAGYGYNTYRSEALDKSNQYGTKRPAFVFTQYAHEPLLYDAGISELVDPNDTVSMIDRPGSITVKMKNYGALNFNAIRISCQIDDSVFRSYDWTGNLAPNAEEQIVVADDINIAAGFHVLKVWVEDTLTALGAMYRDHEPYNDTMTTEFTVCDGPMHGVKNIGGPDLNFNSISEFLTSLTRCGIDDSVIVRLAPGLYEPFSMPNFNGLSQEHYIVFESQDPDNPAEFYSDGNRTCIINIENMGNMRFRDLKFVRRDGTLERMVALGLNSHNCHFERCSFIDSLGSTEITMQIPEMLSTFYTNNFLVDGCTFIGGKIGVNIVGLSIDNRPHNTVVKNSLFRNQNLHAVKAENQSQVAIEYNEMYDVLENTYYVLQLSECYDTSRVIGNKVYTSHGAGGIGISDFHGTEDVHALVANNMIVSAYEGNVNARSCINFISGTWADVVYNSVKQTMPNMSNKAAVTYGGGLLTECRFMNNLVVSLDESNYALSYQPMNSTTAHVSNNVYYSNGPILNRPGTTSNIFTIEAWRAAVLEDSLSISANPYYLNGGLVDLRTFNRLIKGVGVPLANVPIDMFGTERSLTATCVGAFEFVSLGYDFEPEALMNPVAETCEMPDLVPVAVRLRNSGVNQYVGGVDEPLTINVSVNGGSTHSYVVTQTVPAEDTATLTTTIMLQLPPNGIYESVYNLMVWTLFDADPNQTNDTNYFTVISRYHPSSPGNAVIEAEYNQPAVITPTEGIDQWVISDNPAAPLRGSQIFWYHSPNDNEPFYSDSVYVTEPLLEDQTYYIRQRRAMPLVRITQVELKHSSNPAGLTNPMPTWVNDSRKILVQLTNIGDATAYLEGDTITTVSQTSSLNGKAYRFGNVKIEPGQSLVLQYASAAATDSSKTLRIGFGDISVSTSSKEAFIYKTHGRVEDVVVINAVTADALAGANIPSYLWTGDGVAPTSTTAGIIRTGFSGSAADWRLSTNDAPMTIGTTDQSLIRYQDNGCEGGYGTINVVISNPPTTDLALSDLVLPDDGCGLFDETVSVHVQNYGIAAIPSFELHYSVNDQVVDEIVESGIEAHGSMVYSFNTGLNLNYPVDSTVTVRAWATAPQSDFTQTNDTVEGSVTSLYTPGPLTSVQDHMAEYAKRDTIVCPYVGDKIPIWYDAALNPIDTGYTHITDILYGETTMGVANMALISAGAQVGDGTSVNASGSTVSFPSPYHTGNKYAKQQYLYTAYDLSSNGLTPGKINKLSFYLQDIVGTQEVTSYLDYTISIGATTDTIFSNKNSWKTADHTVFYRSQFDLTQDQEGGWVEHVLDTPYEWDGVSNLVVQVYYHLTSKIASGVKTRYTTKTKTVLYKAADDVVDIDFTGDGTTPTNKRPNIIFTYDQPGCAGPITTFNISLHGIPEMDAALFWPSDAGETQYVSCDSIDIPVLLRNQGSTPITEVKFCYWLDTMAKDSTIVSGINMIGGVTEEMVLFRKKVTPGRHTVRAAIEIEGDNITTNDTVIGNFDVMFCGGSYTINPVEGDYHSICEVTDTMNSVGIAGPVVFLVSNGVYDGQVSLTNIRGSSNENSISFYGMGDSVVVRANPTKDDNYVMKVDGVSNVNINNITMQATPGTATISSKTYYYGHVLTLKDVARARVTNSTMRSSKEFAANDADNKYFLMADIALLGNVSNLTVSSCTLDSAAYGIRSYGTVNNYSNIRITGNVFNDFAFMGVNVRGIQKLYIGNNNISSSNGSNSRGLEGLYLAQVTDSFTVERNYITLISQNKAAKRGIELQNVTGSNTNRGMVVNNMISCVGTDAAGLDPAISSGIWIDSSSTLLNITYNTVRVSTGNPSGSNNDKSRAFYCGSSASTIKVSNNILSNFSKGYAFYTVGTSVTISKCNALYSVSSKPYRVNNVDKTTLTLFQNAIGDAGSVEDEPYFIASDDLHLLMTNFCGLADFDEEVPYDIDGTIRSQIPPPTIGAHELERLMHDMSLVRVHEPLVSTNNIETDSVRVIVSIYNNGRSTETNVRWYAYVEGYYDETCSDTVNIGTFAPSQMKNDTLMMPTVLGLIDTHVVRIVVLIDGDVADWNNELTTEVNLQPAFNLEADKVEVLQNGCDMYGAPVKITIKNVGKKPMPAGTQIKIGYNTQVTTPADLVIPGMTGVVEQYVTLENQMGISGGSATTSFTFDSLANVYPTDTAIDIKVRFRGWVIYAPDLRPDNDTTVISNTKSPIKDAFYKPNPPFGFDTTWAYGTWGAVRAMQENGLKILWHNDTTSSPFYGSASSVNYVKSTLWDNNTPQIFEDTIFYLRCKSTSGCYSNFSVVHVDVADRINNDMAIEQILSPVGGRVYMENDTVRVQVANYGLLPQTNIPISYHLKTGNNWGDTVTEIITSTIAPGQKIVYTFDSLVPITTPTSAKNYAINVWTSLPTDGTLRNDTVRNVKNFSSLAQTKYNTRFFTPETDPSSRFDITRVSWNGIDMEMPALNRSVTDMADYTTNKDGAPNPEYPAVHVTRGTSDSIFIEVTPMEAEVFHFRCRATVEVDFNRNGEMDVTNDETNERIIDGAVFYNDSVFRGLITIPQNASYGYQRLRITVKGYEAESEEGHSIDFLLFVDEMAPEADVAISQIVAPRSYLIRDGIPREVSFRILNRGRNPITNLDINYSFDAYTMDAASTGVLHWTGNIAPGHSAVATLPAHHFCVGTTTLHIWHAMNGDADSTNNHIYQQYHRFHEVILTLDDDFDQSNLWFAPEGKSIYSKNYWQRGNPGKTRISTPHSGDNAWVTDLTETVTTGKRGSVSYLYSPIINISQIRADTLSFYLQRDLKAIGSGASALKSSFHVEFYNYQNQWVKVDDEEAVPSLPNWYNDTVNRYFTGTNTANNYKRYWFCTDAVSGDFQERLQFRLVYSTPMGTASTSSFGEGCAVDDLRITRARRQIDAGVVDITYPEAPQIGQTIYPVVVVKNYGYDTLRNFDVGYTHFGTNLAKISHITNAAIPPDGFDTIYFDASFTITREFPEDFSIEAFTIISSDIYRDNDTSVRSYHLSPLEYDISADYFVAPLDFVIAGDTTVPVTMHIRNAGSHPIPNATVTYQVNGGTPVVEHIDFVADYGGPLMPRDLNDPSVGWINYTFHRHIRATMGLMRLSAFVKCDSNDYIYNDTIQKRVEGITSVSDVAAAGIIVDSVSSPDRVQIQLAIDNRGARGANSIEVGYWIDGDTSTMVTEVYYRSNPIPALSRGYHLFEHFLPRRPEGYPQVNAYVRIANDNDPSNDTTDLFMEQYVDIEVVKMVVEENSSEDCRVFAVLHNVGNMTLYDRPIRLNATINGNPLVVNIVRRMDPDMTIFVQFDRAIPKSPTRHYNGLCQMLDMDIDHNPDNNQSTVIQVSNYVEGIETADAVRLELGQNYPNPFTHQTTIPFTLPSAATVRILVIDAAGHIVFDRQRACTAGRNSVTVDMDALPAGIYYYGIVVDGQRQMRKMNLK